MNNTTSLLDELPYCEICRSSVTFTYRVYNMMVAGVCEPLIGLCGLIGNALAVLIYSRPSMRSSMNFYLCVLALSDMVVIMTAFFLFVLLAMECVHPIIPWVYGYGTPVVYPISMLAQTTSVYFVVAAAVDCCITVVMPLRIRRKLCTIRAAQMVSGSIFIIAVAYNTCHFFETKTVACWEPYHNATSVRLYPTTLRMNQFYIDLYYTYMYTIIMAIGPLISLIVINTFIISLIYLAKRRRLPQAPGTTSENLLKEAEAEADTVTLILVVFMFIFCNSLALVINFLENKMTGEVLTYLVDVSNLLVVFNSSCNFFIYYAFGESFRKTLKFYFGQQLSRTRMYCGGRRESQVIGCNPSDYWPAGDSNNHVNEELPHRLLNQRRSTFEHTQEFEFRSPTPTPVDGFPSKPVVTNGTTKGVHLDLVQCYQDASTALNHCRRAPLAAPDDCNGIPLSPVDWLVSTSRTQADLDPAHARLL